MQKTNYKRTINYKVISPEEIKKLVKICYEPWENQLEEAEIEWERERKQEVVKKINKHNQDVKNKKPTYSFNTYLPISESDKQKILEMEKEFFIYTLKRIHVFDGKIRVEENDKSRQNTDPNFLNDMSWEKVERLSVEVRAERQKAYGSKTINISFIPKNSTNRGIEYEIEGNDEDWVRATKSQIDETLDGLVPVHMITKHVGRIAILSSFLLFYTVYSIIYKFNINDFLYNTTPVVDATMIKIIVGVGTFIAYFAIEAELSFLFPKLIITERYSPFEGKVKVVAAIISALSFSALYDLFKYLFI